MKTMHKLLALLLAAALCCGICLIPSAAADETAVGRPAVVQVGAVNVRKSPSESADRIGGLTLGREIFVVGRTTEGGKSWYKIYYQDGYGYILSTAALLIKDVGMVNVGAVRVRAGADTSALGIGELLYGRSVNILETIENGSGETWYRISYGLLDGYVMAKYVGILTLPTQGASAKYKKDVTVRVTGYNVPIGYRMSVDTELFHASTGEKEYTASHWLGQCTASHTVTVRILDESGNLKAESKLNVEVKNGLFAKIGAFFLYMFSGFRWGEQTVEIK